MATIISRPRSSDTHDAALIYALTGILFALVVGIFVFSVLPALMQVHTTPEQSGVVVSVPIQESAP